MFSVSFASLPFGTERSVFARKLSVIDSVAFGRLLVAANKCNGSLSQSSELERVAGSDLVVPVGKLDRDDVVEGSDTAAAATSGSQRLFGIRGDVRQ